MTTLEAQKQFVCPSDDCVHILTLMQMGGQWLAKTSGKQIYFKSYVLHPIFNIVFGAQSKVAAHSMKIAFVFINSISAWRAVFMGLEFVPAAAGTVYLTMMSREELTEAVARWAVGCT